MSYCTYTIICGPYSCMKTVGYWVSYVNTVVNVAKHFLRRPSQKIILKEKVSNQLN